MFTVSNRNANVAISLTIIDVGVALLLSQLFPAWVFFWPAVLFMSGVVMIATAPRPDTRFWGSLLVIAGILLELIDLGTVHAGAEIIWPLLIIGLGVKLLLQNQREKQPEIAPNPADATSLPPDSLNIYAIFGGGERRIEAKNFRQGRLLAIFGGYKVDMTHADIEGSQGVLEFTGIFGGGEVRVPDNWLVVMQGVDIFGGYVDKTRYYPADPSRAPKTLIIKGYAIFGGVVARN